MSEVFEFGIERIPWCFEVFEVFEFDSECGLERPFEAEP